MNDQTIPRRVLIVDDSRTVRALLRTILDADPRLCVVGEAADPIEARELIKRLSPDVITLDVEMPRMNGLDFLERLMRLRPMPVVMVSTRTKARSEIAVRALSIGAVDCVDVAGVQADLRQRLRLSETLFAAANARVCARLGAQQQTIGRSGSGDYRWNGRTVLLGSSTGGVDAIERVLSVFPANGPPVIIAQHMPEAFLRSLCQRLDDLVAPTVRLVSEGDMPSQGTVLLAPGGRFHAGFASAHSLQLTLVEGTPDDLYVPSVDQLFHSGVPHAPRLVGVILTGMGRDGAAGLLALRNGGARTIAQTGETCVVDGMPRAAREAGAAERAVDLEGIGSAILDACSSSTRRTLNA
ncbi:MAG: chemotaxis-specific protein-glutamate methyltransferase CheB [Pseudomonadota bacterium]